MTETEFWNHTERRGDCWLWTGLVNGAGYGSLSYGHRSWMAHRLAYTLATGPIPRGLIVRHRCDTPLCINPAHLEVGTYADNTRDMFSRGRRPPKTHCLRGHEFTEAETRIDTKGFRVCRICERDRSRRKFAAGRPNYRPLSRDPRYCLRGHERTPENTRVYGRRKFCKDCEVARRKSA